MIPKKIHYCWFGKAEKPKLAKKCIASWKKYCPDYEIIEWNEDNFDVYKNEYTKYCYDNKKWAFLSDYVRLDVVSQYGGIYFVTDVEVIKPFDDLLNYDAFYGFESKKYVASGLGFGSVSHHVTIDAMMEEYTKLIEKNNIVQTVGCPRLNTNALIPFGLELNGLRQNVAGAEILPSDYFNPYDDPTGILNKTDNTYSIHWYGKSWLDKKTIIRSNLLKPVHRIFGKNCFDFLKK
jgi:hypothetical protein